MKLLHRKSFAQKDIQPNKFDLNQYENDIKEHLIKR